MSAASQWTPGPWIIGGAREDAEDACYVSIYAGAKPGSPEIAGRVSESNAALIAAAPDMAEALTALVGICDRHSDTPDEQMETILDSSAMTRARAALAKACGETSR